MFGGLWWVVTIQNGACDGNLPASSGGEGGKVISRSDYWKKSVWEPFIEVAIWLGSRRQWRGLRRCRGGNKICYCVFWIFLYKL